MSDLGIYKPDRARGFTLIEMLVVVVLAGIVIAMVSISATPNPRRELRLQAEQLSQLFIAAQDEAYLTGRPILWEADQEGFRFTIRQEDRWEMPANEALRQRPWRTPVTRVVMDNDRSPRLLFTREVMAAPVAITLQHAQASVTLRADALGRFQIDEPS